MARQLSVLITIATVLFGCGARTGTQDRNDAGYDAAPDAPILPPTALCEPEEAWTTVGRRTVFYGDGEDDGWIASWFWTINERPTGSVVSLVPPESQISSLTPDAEGDYIVELEVTDDQGATATCQTTVHSIVGPPVAFCPEDIFGAAIGRAYTLEGDGFDDEAIVSFSWTVTESPRGSSAEPEPADEPLTTFSPDIAGTYVLTLTVTDNDGQSGMCDVMVTSSGPPIAICPEEATVPTRQPHLVEGDAEDDGEIAIWLWEIVERPAGSTVAPSPAAAQDTTLTPDRVGRFVLRLTVTDDTGLSDSCEAIVNATPTPPDAICPDRVTTTPLTEVALRGEWADDGTVVGWEWTLVSRPDGSAALAPEPPDTQTTFFTPDIAGEYTLLLAVFDDDGMEGTCETTVLAIPGEGLRIELFWNPPDQSCDTHPGPDCDSSDVDLHLLHPDAPHWFDSTPGRSDCYYATCIGGEEWDTAAIEDNPRLDLDDVDGHGPENINIDEPVIGNSYTVGVHYYADDGDSRIAQIHMRVYCGTVSADPVYEAGPVPLRAFGWSTENEFWRVATVVWDGAVCTVTPLFASDGSPDIISASDAESRR